MWNDQHGGNCPCGECGQAADRAYRDEAELFDFAAAAFGDRVDNWLEECTDRLAEINGECPGVKKIELLRIAQAHINEQLKETRARLQAR